MELSDLTQAIAAATSVVASVGLPASDAFVLQNSNQLALRLTPCDVFARVAHVGREVAEREVELAQRLAEAGCPVARLEPRVDPRVYKRDGFAVTLWTYYEPVTPLVSPADYAHALERLHAGIAQLMCRARGSRTDSRRPKKSLPARSSRRSSPTPTAHSSAAD